jgi:hypothetical protein
VVARAEALGDVVGRVAEFRQILPDAEAAPRPGDHDRADVVGARLPERSAQALVHRAVECVELVRPVERDRQDRALTAREHGLCLGGRHAGGFDLGHRRNLGAFPRRSRDHPAARVI